MADEQKYKVVIDDDRENIASAGAQKKTGAFAGMTEDAATQDCAVRNARSEELGIKTRYKVVEHEVV